MHTPFGRIQFSTKSAAITLCSEVLLVGVLLGVLIGMNNAGGGMHEGDQKSGQYGTIHASKMTIEAERIPLLTPHEHVVGDSLYNPSHHQLVSSDVIVVPEDIWVTGVSFSLTNADAATLHHAILHRLDRSDPVCPNYAAASVFVFGADGALRQISFTDPYALFLPKDTPLLLQVMLHNPLPPYGPGKEYTNVRPMMTLDVEPATEANNKVPVESYRLHVSDTPCNVTSASGEVFSVPPRTEHFIKKGEEVNGMNSAKVVFPADGTIIGMGAHLHAWEGGEQVDVSVNGNLLETLASEKMSDAPWSWKTAYRYPATIPVRKGDVLSLTATYSNPGPLSIEGAMGMLSVFFAARSTP
ncbi:MAG: hypothetical protein WD850_00670 [Candidatus Spechtbacterales bacterium]